MLFMARRGEAGQGGARHGKAGRGKARLFLRGVRMLVAVRQGWARRGEAGQGGARQGKALFESGGVRM
jgi:hypothetical protein